MTTTFLSEEEAFSLVTDYVSRESHPVTTQEIIDSGVVPALVGFVVRPGKVSDSIFGGPGSFTDKASGREVEFVNPPLIDRDGTPLRIMVRTQKISTHDLSRGDIPFKDQILALNHDFMRRMVVGFIGASQFHVDGLGRNSVVILAENLTQVPFENVLRAYMAKSSTETSLYVHYMAGERTFCGHALPDDLMPNGILPYVMDTPSTKSDDHDESVEPDYLFVHNICTPLQYAEIKQGSLVAFKQVSDFLRSKGIILADTKIEHGINRHGEIVSQDELFTLDSSRFWLADDYAEQVAALERGEIAELNPKSYSKEFARGISKGDNGYNEEERIAIAVRYIEGIQHLLGCRFEPDMRPWEERVIVGLKAIAGQALKG